MKKLLFATFIFLIFTFPVSAQVTVSQEFLDDATKAFTLVVEQRDAIARQQAQITALEKLVSEVEKSQRTPCTLAQEKVKQDLTYWLNQKGDERELQKILKFTRKNGQRSIASQCGFDNKSALAKVWDIFKTVAPIGAVLLVR